MFFLCLPPPWACNNSPSKQKYASCVWWHRQHFCTGPANMGAHFSWLLDMFSPPSLVEKFTLFVLRRCSMANMGLLFSGIQKEKKEMQASRCLQNNPWIFGHVYETCQLASAPWNSYLIPGSAELWFLEQSLMLLQLTDSLVNFSPSGKLQCHRTRLLSPPKDYLPLNLLISSWHRREGLFRAPYTENSCFATEPWSSFWTFLPVHVSLQIICDCRGSMKQSI